MRKLLITLIAACFATSALAADLPLKRAPRAAAPPQEDYADAQPQYPQYPQYPQQSYQGTCAYAGGPSPMSPCTANYGAYAQPYASPCGYSGGYGGYGYGGCGFGGGPVFAGVGVPFFGGGFPFFGGFGFHHHFRR